MNIFKKVSFWFFVCLLLPVIAYAEEEAKIVNIDFTVMPEGMGILKSLGTVILTSALGILLLIEFYKLIMHGNPDFITPIVKIGIGIFLINVIPSLGGELSGLVNTISVKMLKDDVLKIAADAMSAAMRSSVDLGMLEKANNVISPTTWTFLLVWLTMYGILIIKVVMIDILCPIMLALVIFGGYISIPIGMYPGTGTLKGWIMNVVEVSMWPVVFTVLTTLLFATFQGQLQTFQKKTLGDMRETYEAVYKQYEESKVDKDSFDHKRLSMETTKFQYSLILFLAVSVGFGVLCIGTPMVARTIVRGESAAFLASVAAAGTVAAIGYAQKAISGSAGAASGAGGAIGGAVKSALKGAGSKSGGGDSGPGYKVNVQPSYSYSSTTDDTKREINER